MASFLSWAALTATQPVVWAVLAVAGLMSLPLLLGSRLFGHRPASIAWKHVLITGGSEGVGLEIARLAAARGARISLVARTRSKLDAARAVVLSGADAATATVAVFPADVGDGAALRSAIAAAEAEHGPVDVCIAAAGAAFPKYFEDLDEADYEKMMRVNYMGVVHAARALLPRMAQRAAADPSSDPPHFAAISSIAAAVPFIGYAAYAPSKAATRAFVDVLRNEFVDTRVQFHLAFPPDMDTPGFKTENATKPYETSHIWPEMFNEVFAPKDVAQLLLDDLLAGRYFLRSPDTFGDLLVTRAWGARPRDLAAAPYAPRHYPRARPLLEAALAPAFVGLHCGMVWMADRAVRNRNHHGTR